MRNKTNSVAPLFKLPLSLFIIIGTTGLTLKTHAQNSGIGTTSPASKLHVVGSGNTSSTSSFQVQNSTNTPDKPLFYVRDDGKIGIGTYNFNYSNILHIESTSEWPILFRSLNSTTGNRNHLLMQRSNNGAAVTTNFNLGGISMAGYDGTGYSQGWNGGAEIHAIATQNWTSLGRGTCLAFSTTRNDTTVDIERMRIDHNGNLGVGTTAPYYKVEAMGDIYANQGALMTTKWDDAGGIVAIFNHKKTAAGQNIVYKLYNMTNGYSDKFSIWAYPQTGTGVQRFNIFDNGQFAFHNAAGDEKVRITNSGNVGIADTDPKNAIQIDRKIALHNGGHRIIAFGWDPAAYPGSLDWQASEYAAEIRFDPVNGTLDFGTSAGTLNSFPGPSMQIDKNGNVGVATQTAKSKFEINGSISYKTITKSVSYTAGDETVILASNTITITLPLAGDAPGRIYIVKRVGTGNITISPSSGQSLEGTVNGTQTLTVANQRMTVVSDGVSGWYIIN